MSHEMSCKILNLVHKKETGKNDSTKFFINEQRKFELRTYSFWSLT